MTEKITYHEQTQEQARLARAELLEEQKRILHEKAEAKERAYYSITEKITYNQLQDVLIGIGILPTDTKEIVSVSTMGQQGIEVLALRYYPLDDVREDRVLNDIPRAAPINMKPVRKDISDDELLILVHKIISEEPKVIADFKAGRVKAIDALVGAVMKDYKTDAKMVKDLFLTEVK